MVVDAAASFKSQLLQRGAASALGIALAMAASPAAAQQTVPGTSPNCPIVGDEAVCEGDLEDGITTSPSSPSFGTLTVQNANGPIAPAGYFGIGVVKNDRDITIDLADDLVINVYDDPNIGGAAQGLIAIVDQGFDLTIDTGATISANGNGSTGLGIETLVSNGGGDLSITNRGDIDAFSSAPSAMAIRGRAQNSTGAITIENSGDLSAESGGTGERDFVTAGILVEHDTGGGNIAITNSGAISATATTTDTDFNGIAAGIVTNSFVGANSTSITNSGAITATGQAVHGIVGFTSNDAATDRASISIVNNMPGTLALQGEGNYGILAQSAGTNVDIAVSNTASITMADSTDATGVFVLDRASTSDISLVNSGAISGNGDLLQGLGILTYGAPAGGTYDILAFNTGDITLDTDLGIGIGLLTTRDASTEAEIVNGGNIDLSTTTDATSSGISVSLNAVDPNAGGAVGTSIADLNNNGDITMGAGRGIRVLADDITLINSGAVAIGTGTGIIAQDFVNLALTNEGAVTTTGADSDGIVADASRATGWQVLVDETGSVITSGAGSVGIRISGVSDDYIDAQIQETTTATTIRKAQLADRAMNAITQTLTSSVPTNQAFLAAAPQGYDGVIVNGTVHSDGGAGAIVGDSALSVSAQNAGAIISTTGDDAPAISAQSSIRVTGLDGLTLTTTGDNSELVQLAGGGQGTPGDSAAYVALNNLTASTQGDGSSAFVLDSGGGNSVANFEINTDSATNASTITTMGEGSDAVRFVTSAGGSSTFTGDIANTQISTAGEGSLGFNLDLGGNSSASLALADSSVTTGGVNSDAIHVSVGDGSDALLLIQNSTVSTTGNGSDAVDIPQLANGSIGDAVIIDSDIATEGDDARGFVFAETGGDSSSRTAFITDSSFTTQGDGSTALLFDAFGDSSNNTTSIFGTTITTAGSNARGIDHGLDGDSSSTSITIENTTVATTGATNAGAMIFDGTADVGSAFTILLTDLGLATVGTDSDGVFIGGGGFENSVFNTESSDLTISTQGDNSRGFVVSQFIADDISTTTGAMSNITVTTEGTDAHGIWIGTSGDGAMVDSSSSLFATNLDISTQGIGARGFYLAGLTGDMTDSDFTLQLTESSIATSGDDAIGLELWGVDGAISGSTNTVVLANVDVATTGDGAHGWVVGKGLDDFSLTDDFGYNGIAISTSGALAHALYLRSGAQFTFTEDNNLTLDATGAGSYELFVGADAQFALLSGALRQSDNSFADARIVGTLSGGGSIGSVTVTGGTIAPGNSIGTLTINGDLTFDAGSVFEVEVDDQGNADKLVVNGGVTLGGATLDVVETGTFAGSNPFNYTIIDNDAADAVNGTFGTIQNDYAFLTPTVSYTGGTGNDVVLKLTPNNVSTGGCTTQDRTITCTGDQSDGISIDDSDDVDALIVRDLTTDIQGSTSAIEFERDTGPISITADDTVTMLNTRGIIAHITDDNEVSDADIVVDAQVDTITSYDAPLIQAINEGTGDIDLKFSGAMTLTNANRIDPLILAKGVGTNTVDFLGGSLEQLDNTNASTPDEVSGAILVGGVGAAFNRVTSAGDITTRSDHYSGIYAATYETGGAVINQTGGTIRTMGDASAGIMVEHAGGFVPNSQLGQIADITISGSILTEGGASSAGSGGRDIYANGILISAVEANPGAILNGGTNPTATIEITETGRIFTQNSSAITTVKEGSVGTDTLVPLPIDFTVTIAGEVARPDASGVALDLWDGDDTVTVTATGSVTGQVLTGNDDDIVTNSGTIDGAVSLGAGADTFVLTTTGNVPAVDGGAGDDVFALDGTGSGTFDASAADVTNIESLEKRGSGTWTLTGTAAAGFPLAGSLLDGSLIVNGNYGSLDLDVLAGTRLGGSGTTGSLTSIGGTIAPGNSIGTLTVNGDLTFDANTVFEVEVDDQGNSDKLVVNGGVTLGGATLDVVETGTFAGSNPFNYTIIDNDAADAVDGTFGTIQNDYAFLTPTVSYTGGDGNDVVLKLTPNNVSTGGDATWLAQPGSNGFNTDSNWDPAHTPGSGYTAFFNTSDITSLTFAEDTTVGGWTFNAGADDFLFSNGPNDIIFDGNGIVVDGGGATIRNQFGLVFNNASTAGSATIENENGDLVFNDSSSAGNAIINNSSNVLFFDTSTAGNATINSGQSLIFQDSSTAGNATITNTFGLNFVDDSTAGNATITNDQDTKPLFFSDNSTAGNATITNTGNGDIRFGDNSTGGLAQFTTDAGSETNFSFSTGPAGDGRLSAGSLAGAGDYVLGDNELTVGGNDLSSTVSGVISGTGAATGTSLIKTGTGTFTLSGANTYTGATSILEGVLLVNGSIDSPVTVNSGATLGGSGSTGAVTSVGGTIATGNSIGTLTVNGDLVFDANTLFQVEVDDTGAGDKLVVNGGVTLGGATLDVVESGTFAGDDPFNYVIIDNDAADAVSGTFGTIQNDYSFLTPTVSYTAGDGNDVQLTLTPNVTTPPTSGTGLFPTAATTFNQTSSAVRLDNLDRSDADADDVYMAVLFTTNAQAPVAFETASGEVYATLLAEQGERGLSRSRRLLARASEQAGDGWGIWGGVHGHTGSIDADGNGAKAERDGFGADLGLDYRGGGNAWAVGANVSWDKGSLDIADRLSQADLESWSAGAFARYGSGHAGFTLSAAADYTATDADVSRRIAFGTFSRSASGTTNYDGFAVSAEARYGIGTPGAGWAFGPVVSIANVSADFDGVSETGANALNLSGSGNSFDLTRFGGGVFANWQGAMGALDLSAQYVGGSSEFAQVDLSLAGSPSTAQPIRSPLVDGEGVVLGASGHITLGGNWTLGAETRAMVGSDSDEIAGNINVGWRF